MSFCKKKQPLSYTSKNGFEGAENDGWADSCGAAAGQRGLWPEGTAAQRRRACSAGVSVSGCIFFGRGILLRPGGQGLCPGMAAGAGAVGVQLGYGAGGLVFGAAAVQVPGLHIGGRGAGPCLWPGGARRGRVAGGAVLQCGAGGAAAFVVGGAERVDGSAGRAVRGCERDALVGAHS